MALFRKKPDPISDRARALNDEIAELEEQIKQLDQNCSYGEVQNVLGLDVPKFVPDKMV